MDSDSIKMLEAASSAIFFVNEGDQTRVDQFWRLKSRFPYLIPAPILDSQNLYDSARAKQSIDFAIGRGIYQSSNALTGKTIEKPVAIERGGGQKAGNFNYWLGNYARKIQGGVHDRGGISQASRNS
ncbi:MAG: hypothetical protein IJT59_00350 [Desulfovibrionaceae bacterium]|nr:hypothetical protein [Desulfovibrionaceae bacterium]